MQVQSEGKLYDAINVTPMLDLAYVLLVVFILMTTATVQGLAISLPKPSNKPSSERHEIKIVQVAPDGTVLVNGAGVSLAQLAAVLEEGKRRDPKMQVLIKGDPGAQYVKVIAVVDVCDRLQVNMGLVTAKIGT
jgi:biopolymer transport protein ExbD